MRENDTPQTDNANWEVLLNFCIRNLHAETSSEWKRGVEYIFVAYVPQLSDSFLRRVILLIESETIKRDPLHDRILDYARLELKFREEDPAQKEKRNWRYWWLRFSERFARGPGARKA
jgi:hypothetical protein